MSTTTKSIHSHDCFHKDAVNSLSSIGRKVKSQSKHTEHLPVYHIFETKFFNNKKGVQFRKTAKQEPLLFPGVIMKYKRIRTKKQNSCVREVNQNLRYWEITFSLLGMWYFILDLSDETRSK